MDKIVTIIGGNGFLGRYVVRDLARAGWRIRIVCRHPKAAEFLKTAGELGQISFVYGDLARPETVLPYVFETDAVVNLVGILAEHGRQRFDALHRRGAESIAKAARMAKVSALVQVSALGVNRAADSAYAQAKLAGEQAARMAFPEAMVLRPSVMFGDEDGFLNRFAQMAVFSPFVPVIGGGLTRFQPVYVADVARAVRVCLQTPAAHGKTFELGGPEVFEMRHLVEYIVRQTGSRARLVNIPFGLAAVMARFTQFLPEPLKLTPDQVRLLHYDNVVDGSAFALLSLGITPTALSLVAPEVLSRYRRLSPAYA